MLTGSDLQMIRELKAMLQQGFRIKYLGDLKFFSRHWSVSVAKWTCFDPVKVCNWIDWRSWFGTCQTYENTVGIKCEINISGFWWKFLVEWRWYVGSGWWDVSYTNWYVDVSHHDSARYILCGSTFGAIYAATKGFPLCRCSQGYTVCYG